MEIRLLRGSTKLHVVENQLPSNTVKPFLSGHSKRRPKIGFQDRLLLNAGPKDDLH